MSWRPLKVDLILIFQQQMSDEPSPADFIKFCILGEQFRDSFQFFFFFFCQFLISGMAELLEISVASSEDFEY